MQYLGMTYSLYFSPYSIKNRVRKGGTYRLNNLWEQPDYPEEHLGIEKCLLPIEMVLGGGVND